MPADNRTTVLKEYFSRYLTYIRKNKPSTIKHYYDALNNISRRLKSKGLIHESIYEVADLEQLFRLRDILYCDPEFVDYNTRGNNMYSSGLNRYLEFASGKEFSTLSDGIHTLDVPIAKEQAVVVSQKVWKRSAVLKTQAFELAHYQCELNHNHATFIAESTHKPYMEGHHAIPMNYQDDFDVSLDVYANIICLCPVCHRQLHYGLTDEKVPLLTTIYNSRMERLNRSGIEISKNDFIDLFIENHMNIL